MNGFIIRNPKLAWREIDGETVIISPEDSQVHELNETASLIWKHAEGKTSQQVAERVSAEYEISVAAARADVDALVAAWQQKHLVFLAAEAKG
jgi:hypothetical protein